MEKTMALTVFVRQINPTEKTIKKITYFVSSENQQRSRLAFGEPSAFPAEYRYFSIKPQSELREAYVISQTRSHG